MIYLDTSAMVKLVVAEEESAHLIKWLNTDPEQPLVTSVIGHVELIRAAGRLGPAAVAAAQRLATTIDTLILTDAIANLAATLGPSELRTLDAIHLATAHIHRRSLVALCAYDHRLVATAQTQQLPVATPGAR
jgi:hypothetical protein